MATYVFLNVPAHGHVNATLAVAQELVRRGERVVYYLSEAFRAAVEATGAIFRAYDPDPGGANAVGEAGGDPAAENPLPALMARQSAIVLPQVFERVRADRPDFIFYDPMCLWAKIVARGLRVPAIMSRPSYAPTGQRDAAMMMTIARTDGPALSEEAFFAAFGRVDGQVAELCRAYGAEPFPAEDMMLGSEGLNIVFIPRAFQPGGQAFDERRFVFVGPSIQPRPQYGAFPVEQLEGRTNLYISLGTVFNNQAAFFNMCFAAFKDAPWQLLVATGPQVDRASLGPVPVNFVVREYVPQLEVLPYMRLFVTHCGMNSTMEGLYHGVPLVGLPQMPEQRVTARRVEALGLGVMVDPSRVTVEELKRTVSAAMANEGYRANAQAMQAEIREAGGYVRAADAMMAYARGGGR